MSEGTQKLTEDDLKNLGESSLEILLNKIEEYALESRQTGKLKIGSGTLFEFSRLHDESLGNTHLQRKTETL